MDESLEYAKKTILICTGIMFWSLIVMLFPNSFTTWVCELTITDTCWYIAFIIGKSIYNFFEDWEYY